MFWLFLKQLPLIWLIRSIMAQALVRWSNLLILLVAKIGWLCMQSCVGIRRRSWTTCSNPLAGRGLLWLPSCLSLLDGVEMTSNRIESRTLLDLICRFKFFLGLIRLNIARVVLILYLKLWYLYIVQESLRLAHWWSLAIIRLLLRITIFVLAYPIMIKLL